MGKNILILGAGPGGLESAHALRKGLASEHKITLVDREFRFTMGILKGGLLTGEMKIGEKSGDRHQLTKLGIKFLQGEVKAINVGQREVQVGAERIHYNHLILALGADLSPAATKGFTDHAKNLYTETGCSEIREELQRMNRGTVTVLICAMPFKCPSGPYELTFLIDDILRKRGVRDSIRLRMVTPEPFPVPTLPPEGGRPILQLLEKRGIDYHPSQKVKEIRGNGIVTAYGTEFPHDVVFAVPVHVAPQVLESSGLVDQSGWIPVDPTNLATKAPNVYAIGDCAGTRIPKGALLPRMATAAAGQARTVAQNIIHEIRGEKERTDFDGQGLCFIETGEGNVAIIRPRLYARPEPQWEYSPASTEGMMEKHRFVEERMSYWFPQGG